MAGITGYSVLRAITNGAQKGIFANEAGLGSTPIALATSKTSSATDEGLISMAAMVITMIICLITGLVVIVTKAWTTSLEGLYITDYAFREGLLFNEKFSSILLILCLLLPLKIFSPIYSFALIIGAILILVFDTKNQNKRIQNSRDG